MTRFIFDRITDVLEILALGAFVAAIALITPARAAEAQAMPASHEWAFWIGIGGFIAWMAFLIFCALFPKKQDRAAEPYTKPSDWGMQ